MPLPAVVTQSLARRCEGKRGDDLLLTTPAGTPLRLRNWRRVVFDPAVRAGGLTDVTPHDLRHTAASLAVASDATVKARPADARARLGGHDARRLLRILR